MSQPANGGLHALGPGQRAVSQAVGSARGRQSEPANTSRQSSASGRRCASPIGGRVRKIRTVGQIRPADHILDAVEEDRPCPLETELPRPVVGSCRFTPRSTPVRIPKPLFLRYFFVLFSRNYNSSCVSYAYNLDAFCALFPNSRSAPNGEPSAHLADRP